MVLSSFISVVLSFEVFCQKGKSDHLFDFLEARPATRHIFAIMSSMVGDYAKGCRAGEVYMMREGLIRFFLQSSLA